jgi:hypothetical protein
METAISAVIGEVVSQFISFPRSKYSNNAASEEQKMGRLQHMLLRVRTVVEEADRGRAAHHQLRDGGTAAGARTRHVPRLPPARQLQLWKA